jgi:hypothetical protein
MVQTKRRIKRLKRLKRVLLFCFTFLLFFFVFFSTNRRTSISSVYRTLSIRDPGPAPYKSNPYKNNKSVCEDRGYHYDGLSYVDKKKAQESNEFSFYDEEVRGRFQRKICEHQFFKGDHEERKGKGAVVYADDDPTAGFGSRVLRVCSAFFTAVHLKRPFAYAKVGKWTYSKCESKGNDCYFQKIGSAMTEYETPDGVNRGEGVLVDDKNSKNNKGDDRNDGDGDDSDSEIVVWTRGSLDGFQKENKAGENWIGELSETLGEAAPNGRGGCWVISQFLYYILHPNEKLDRVLRLEKKRMGWDSDDRKESVAAIHVRHGDRAQRGHQGSNLQIEQFLARLRKLDPKCKKVLLMTEDGQVIDDAIKNFGKEFHFYYTTIQPRHNDDINRLLKEGKLDPENEIHNALVNLYLAADADYFLGHLSSTWGRVVLLLSYGKYGCFQKMDLMESTWKSRWGFSSCSTDAWEKESKKFMCKGPR